MSLHPSPQVNITFDYIVLVPIVSRIIAKACGRKQGEKMAYFCSSISRQRFDAVGALTLAITITFNHVALTFERRNKYVLENGSSDPSQIHVL